MNVGKINIFKTHPRRAQIGGGVVPGDELGDPPDFLLRICLMNKTNIGTGYGGAPAAGGAGLDDKHVL
jgi:hypothetical protein